MSKTDSQSADEVGARRGSSFGTRASAYAEHRPDYPREAVGWLLAPLRAAGRPRVLDLGAGTGKLTGILAEQAADVIAVEPDPGMLAELRLRIPGVRSLAGAAERIPLAGGSVDAVLVAQAALVRPGPGAA